MNRLKEIQALSHKLSELWTDFHLCDCKNKKLSERIQKLQRQIDAFATEPFLEIGKYYVKDRVSFYKILSFNDYHRLYKVLHVYNDETEPDVSFQTLENTHFECEDFEETSEEAFLEQFNGAVEKLTKIANNS